MPLPSRRGRRRGLVTCANRAASRSERARNLERGARACVIELLALLCVMTCKARMCGKLCLQPV
eukprot:1162136-Pelagomonas_calceolata.AAC.9